MVASTLPPFHSSPHTSLISSTSLVSLHSIAFSLSCLLLSVSLWPFQGYCSSCSPSLCYLHARKNLCLPTISNATRRSHQFHSDLDIISKLPFLTPPWRKAATSTITDHPLFSISPHYTRHPFLKPSFLPVVKPSRILRSQTPSFFCCATVQVFARP